MAQRQAGLAARTVLNESETRGRAISVTLGRQAPSAALKPDPLEACLALTITHSDQQRRSTAQKWTQGVPLAAVNLQNLLSTSRTSRPILYPGRRDGAIVDSSDEKIDRRTYTDPQLMHTFCMQGEQLEKM
jgi:hypothetical protein